MVGNGDGRPMDVYSIIQEEFNGVTRTRHLLTDIQEKGMGLKDRRMSL